MTASIDISLSRSGDDIYECEDCQHVWKVAPPDLPHSTISRTAGSSMTNTQWAAELATALSFWHRRK